MIDLTELRKQLIDTEVEADQFGILTERDELAMSIVRTLLPKVAKARIVSIVRPVLTETYGNSMTIDAMVLDVTNLITDYRPDELGRDREYLIMNRCWDWRSGGSTAEAVAGKIETALRTAGI